ncbi:EAL domain-containing protein [Vibrio sp. SCSIO 43137]|uniref:EAL domain-containing protein n=1 Tax=Vibrio sp. SCSIO 43137 TaxID=3021011 RepID=UPI0023083185|nr:EAL domain-containing protein [Vibrio sp. SCSIO 43137]WCE32652.1 EAL domain-containing protein [Vibrio sp. SCSIO 43137]
MTRFTQTCGVACTIIPQQLTLQALNFSEHSVYYLGITRDLSGVADKLTGQVFGGVELVTQLPDEKHFVANLNRSLSNQSQNEIVYVAILEPDISNSASGNFKSETSKCIQQYGKHFSFGYLGDNKFALSGSVSLKKNAKNTLKVILSQVRQLNAHLKQQLSPESVRIFTKSKIGISYRDENLSDGGKLIFEACCSLKENHRAYGQIHVYDPVQHHQYLRRRKLEIIARKAIKGRLVEVYYQPIIDASNWRIAKFEALCRFRDRNGAIMNTQEVVKIVESLGLVHELDLIVAEKAIKDREVLAEKFGKDIGITINISLDSSNKREVLLLNLKKLIHREKDKFRYVTIEITESAYFNQDSDDSDITELLKKNDIRVAIDDFGTGYSSFSYLKEQTFDVLKIDQEFVSGLKENTRNYHIIRMIVKLAKVLNVKTVAEGVESQQEALLLHSMGVDMLQGYLFSKPMPLNKCNSISNLLYKIKKEVGAKEIDTIIDSSMTLTPDNDLEDVKQLFDHTDINYLPVISKKRCLGLVNRVNYSKAIPPTLDTPVENTRDRNVLKKKVSQVMETKFVTVNENMSTYEVLELVNEQATLPWVVVNDSMQFIGIVEAKGLLRLTTSLI